MYLLKNAFTDSFLLALVSYPLTTIFLKADTRQMDYEHYSCYGIPFVLWQYMLESCN